MFIVDVTLEDSRLLAQRNENSWDVTLIDNLTGKNKKVEWTDKELASVLALGIWDGSWNGLENELDKVAQPLFEDIDTELRFIP
jgi:hypothetical protein